MNGVEAWASGSLRTLRRVLANLKFFNRTFPSERTEKRITYLENEIDFLMRRRSYSANTEEQSGR